MKATRSKFPKAKTIAITSLQVAKVLPMDVSPTFSWHESERGHAALRVSSITNTMPWNVDIYSEKYMCVRIAGKFSEVCKSIPSLVIYFYRTLKLKMGA
jgi:hypothetical protein